MRQETKPAPCGEYGDSDGWNGISLSAHYLTDCLLHEYQHQESAIKKLQQGTFGQAFCSDHTRKVARKVTFSSGTMSSYAVMNENWMILSWVMVQSETEKSLGPMYEGLATCYSTAGIEKAQYQWINRDCCAAFKVAESGAGEHLNWDAWRQGLHPLVYQRLSKMRDMHPEFTGLNLVHFHLIVITNTNKYVW